MILQYRDYFHSRGEYPHGRGDPSGIVGSSPISRGIRGSFSNANTWHRTIPALAGIRMELASVSDELRIIPALAGNTWTVANNATGTPDHPRSRGEYVTVRLDGWDGEGSSPLSRGILSTR